VIKLSRSDFFGKFNPQPMIFQHEKTQQKPLNRQNVPPPAGNPERLELPKSLNSKKNTPPAENP
jgi:hypothetical protein